jgi:hypothetical protein
MWKVFFVVAAIAFSASPLDAAPDEGRKMPKAELRSELRRDVERISKEIYPRQEQPARPAGGRALKKR